jgi:hypothetical protein
VHKMAYILTFVTSIKGAGVHDIKFKIIFQINHLRSKILQFYILTFVTSIKGEGVHDIKFKIIFQMNHLQSKIYVINIITVSS